MKFDDFSDPIGCLDYSNEGSTPIPSTGRNKLKVILDRNATTANAAFINTLILL